MPQVIFEKTALEGVMIKKLRVITDERGFVMEMLRADDEIYQKFGQVYISASYPEVVKGWHYHKIQTDYMVAIRGMLKLVLCDQRQDSPTLGKIMEIFMGEQNPILVQVPPGVWHGVKNIGTQLALMLNCPTEVYNYEDPDEYREPPHSKRINYDWSRKDG